MEKISPRKHIIEDSEVTTLKSRIDCDCKEANPCDNCICRYPGCKKLIDLCELYRNRKKYTDEIFKKLIYFTNSEYCIVHSGCESWLES